MKSLKLILDLLMGVAIPVFVLNYLSKPLGPVTANVTAALIPVIYVTVDTFFISRRFNVITSYVALALVVRAALAFWYVDGWKFALKDIAASLVSVLVFGGSILAGRPMMRFFIEQIVNPKNERSKAPGLGAFFAQPDMKRALVLGTALVLAFEVVVAAVTYVLALQMVTAGFGTDEFNQQVGRLAALLRAPVMIANLVVFALSFTAIYRAAGRILPKEEDKDLVVGEHFMEMVDKWHAERGSGAPLSAQ